MKIRKSLFFISLLAFSSGLFAYELENDAKGLEKHLFTYYKMMGLYQDYGDYKHSVDNLNKTIKIAEKVVNDNQRALRSFETEGNKKW